MSTVEAPKIPSLEPQVSELDRQLEELEPVIDHYRRLKAARAALTRTPARPANGLARRFRETLALIAAEGGLGGREIAERVGVHPNYAYRVLPELQRRGFAARHGRGWYATAAGRRELAK